MKNITPEKLVHFGTEEVKPGLLTVFEVCALLNVKRARLYSMVFYKKIPHTKIGSSLRFDREKLKAWLEQNSTDEKGGNDELR